jgi:hypothetical protein
MGNATAVTVRLGGVAAAAHGARRPELPGTATPVEDVDGALEVGARVARCVATRARAP